MKTIATIICALVVMTTYAQRKVEKTEKLSSGESVFVDFKFANDIEVQQWDKNEVLVKATVNLNDGEGNEFYSLQSKRRNGTLHIESDFGDYFKKQNKNNNWGGNYTTRIDYVVFVPKNTNLEVKSISGALTTNSYVGDLTTDLISGDIEVKNYKGELYLKTVSGDVDVTMNNASVDARTVTGTIYSDLEIQNNSSRNRNNNRVKGTVNGGNGRVQLETVSGDIFMRKG